MALATAPKGKADDFKATRPAATSQNGEKAHPAPAPAATAKAKPISAGSLGPSAFPLSGKVTPTALAVAETKKTSDSKATRPAAKSQIDENSHPAHAPVAAIKAKPISAGSLGLSALPLSGKVTPIAPAVAEMKKTSDSKATWPAAKGQIDEKSHPAHAPVASIKAKPIPASSLGPSALPLSDKAAARCAFAALRRHRAVAVSSSVTDLCSRV